MYNEDMPTRAELPTSAQLLKSTVIAAISSVLILVTVVMPSEYGIDPTGLGRVLGLTEMGEIKEQLAQEAEDDAKMAALAAQLARQPEQAKPLSEIAKNEAPTPTPAPTAAPKPVVEKIETPKEKVQLVQQAEAAEPPAPVVRDTISITLTPGQGTEVKLVVAEKGTKIFYEWSANGSKLNYDTHGDGYGNAISYEKGRGVASDKGELVAAFRGNHGWFWRNRTKQNVTLTLKTWGDYEKMVRIK